MSQARLPLQSPASTAQNGSKNLTTKVVDTSLELSNNPFICNTDIDSVDVATRVAMVNRIMAY